MSDSRGALVGLWAKSCGSTRFELRGPRSGSPGDAAEDRADGHAHTGGVAFPQDISGHDFASGK
jgi:hypothetical protein